MCSLPSALPTSTPPQPPVAVDGPISIPARAGTDNPRPPEHIVNTVHTPDVLPDAPPLAPDPPGSPRPTKRMVQPTLHAYLSGPAPRLICDPSIPPDHICPSIQLLHSQQALHSNVCLRESSVCPATQTLFTTKSFRPGQLVYYYGGRYQPSHPTGPYHVGLRNGTVDGTPTRWSATDFTNAGRINEWIWDPDKNNLILHPNGTLTADGTKLAKASTELFLYYGSAYDWCPYIHSTLCPNLASVLDTVLSLIPPPAHFLPDLRMLLHHVRTWSLAAVSHPTSLPSVHRFVVNVLSNRIPADSTHRFNPSSIEHLSWVSWLECVLLCEVIYDNIVFRRALNPDGNLPLTLLTTAVPLSHRTDDDGGTRRSTRLVHTRVPMTPLIALFQDHTCRWKPAFLHPSAPQAASHSAPLHTHHSSVCLTDVINQPYSLYPSPPLPSVHHADQSLCDHSLSALSLSQDDISRPSDAALKHMSTIALAHSLSPPAHIAEAASDVRWCPATDPSVDMTIALTAPSPTASPSAWIPLEGDCDPAMLPSGHSTVRNRAVSIYSLPETLSVSNPPSYTSEQTLPSTAPTSTPSDTVPLTTSRLNHFLHTVSPAPYHRDSDANRLTIMSFNAGGFTAGLQHTTILQLIYDNMPDVVAIQDSRLHAATRPLDLQCATLKRSLPPGYWVRIIPAARTKDQPHPLGGAIILCSPRLRHHNVTEICCHGSLVQLTFQFHTKRIGVLSVYMPLDNPADGSFQTRLQAAHPHAPTPIQDHISASIHLSICALRRSTDAVILLGDFNTDIFRPDQHNLHTTLFTTLHMHSSANARERCLPTYIHPTTHGRSQMTRPDHVLHVGQLQPISCQPVYHSSFTTDHVPLVTVYQLHASVPHQYGLRMPTIPAIDATNPAEVDILTKALGSVTMDLSLPAEQRLDNLTETLVNVIAMHKPVKPLPRHRLRNTWCPDNVALSYHLKYMTQLNRLFHCVPPASSYQRPSRARSRQQPLTKRIAAILRAWNAKLTTFAKDSEQLHHFLTLTEHPPAYWSSCSLLDISSTLPTALSCLRSRLKTSFRKQRSDEFKAAICKRETHGQIGRMKLAVRTILPTKRKRHDLASVVVDGVTIVDPVDIALRLTDFKTKWFQPPDQHPVDWDAVLHSETAFHTHAKQRGVPTHLTALIWTALSKTPPPSPALLRFQSDVMRTPTYDEWIQEVQHTSTGSAGGMSGLTYDIIKLLPDETKRDMYNALVELWNTQTDDPGGRTIPSSWRWRWLVPIPKTDDPTLEQLRPLCLLEVLRKSWSAVFIQRIITFLSTQHALNPGQHCQRGKGTDTGVLELIAILETAKAQRSELYLSSWDLRRAFDSVDRHILVSAWTRLGVPHALADYLVAMDLQSHTVVRTPLTVLVHQHLGTAGLADFNLDFSPARGTAQGGVDSSTAFAAFIDILLDALSNTKASNFHLLDMKDHLHPSIPISYVDDLISVASTCADLQTMADVVSAFCIIFQLELNTSKFRAFGINWNNPANWSTQNTIVIHTLGWQPTTVPLDTDGSIKHLGYQHDMHKSDLTQFTLIHSKFKQALNIIQSANASITIKLLLINISLIPQLTYITKFASWTLSQYEQFDTTLAIAVRHITHNRTSFPTALVFLPRSSGGLGIRRPSHLTQHYKNSILQRAYQKGSRARMVASSLLQQVLRSSNQPCVQGQPVTLQPALTSDTFWATSLVEWMHQVQRTLSVHTDMTHFKPGDSLLHAHPTIRPLLVADTDAQASLLRLDISTWAELYMEGDDLDRTRDLLCLPWIPDLPAPPVPVLLRPGQFWLNEDDHSVVQVFGFSDEHMVQYIPWAFHSRTSLRSENNSTHLRGAGTNFSQSVDTLFPHPRFQLLTVGPETFHADGSNHVRLLRSVSRLPGWITDPPAPPTPPWKTWLQHPPPRCLYTDASYTQRGTGTDALLGTQEHVASTAVIKDLGAQGYDGLILIHPTDTCTSNFVPELIGQTIALNAVPCLSVHKVSDSKSGIQLRQRAVNRPTSHPFLPLLLPHPHSTLRHTRAHPEKRKRYHEYTDDDIGIDKADALACGDVDRFLRDNRTGRIKHIMARDFYADLIAHTPFPVTTTFDGMFNMQDLQHLHDLAAATSYLARRDEYRNTRLGQPPDTTHWRGVSVHVAATLHRTVFDRGRTAQLVRQLWHWGYTGYNKHKSGHDPADLQCPLCHAQVEDEQHIIWHCSHPNMSAVRSRHVQHLNHILRQHQAARHPLHRSLYALHTLLMNPHNFSILLGRIHSHQRPLLDSLMLPSQSEPKQHQLAKSLLKHWKQYKAMALDLYMERQNLLTHITRPLTDPNAARRTLDANEVLYGIERYMLLHAHGQPVRSTRYHHPTVIRAQKRTTLTVDNSLYLRAHHPKRLKPTDGIPTMDTIGR